MDVVVLFNGLGNQMSQYAFFLSKKRLNRLTYFIDDCKTHNGLELNRIFSIDTRQTVFQKTLYLFYRFLNFEKAKFISRPIKRILNIMGCRMVFEESDYRFDGTLLAPSNETRFFVGGWHSEKYFSSISGLVLQHFQFKKPYDVENVLILEDISSSNSVSIHVRRGDYVNESNIKLFGDVCNKIYYEKAVALISEKLHDPHFFVFSNDITWVKANLNIANVTYVTCNLDENSWKDMYLMSMCKHNIIANSTFSWWGAWLNRNLGKTVISPSRFLNNDINTEVYPESWIKLADY